MRLLKVVGQWVHEGAPAWDNTFIFNGGSFQPGGSEQNWDGFRADPRISRGAQSRAGQQNGGKNRRDVHASDGFFADEVVPDWARLDSSRQSSSTPGKAAGLFPGENPARDSVVNPKAAEPQETYACTLEEIQAILWENYHGGEMYVSDQSGMDASPTRRLAGAALPFR